MTRLVGTAIACVLVCTACGDDDAASSHDAGRDGGGTKGDASPIGAEAMVALMPVAGGDAGAPDADAGASAQLPLNGTGKFRQTVEGVDLLIDVAGCRNYIAYPMRILDTDDCGALADAEVWAANAGDKLFATCGRANVANVRYARPMDDDKPWSVGGPAATDVTGHVLVVYDPDSDRPLACGAIERVAGTPADAGAPLDAGPLPSGEVLAVLAGACLGNSPANTSGRACPVPEDLVACAHTHCELDRCARMCPDYAACLADAEDMCAPMNCPPVSVECNNCFNDLLSCTLLGFCAPMFACADPPKPGGDCDEIRKCCNSQTMDERKAACLAALDTLIPIVGELGCTSAKADLGFTLGVHKSPECPWGTRPESVP